MLQAAEAMTMREWRVVGFHMAVITLREELIAFYERLGYERTGEFKNFPDNRALWQPKVPDLTLEYLVKIIKR
jgi:ribosomal protein S18 acetylase RimI-like enzyme